jgi:hypothetical protein
MSNVTPKCPDCERHKYRAALWRAEAYRQAGHDVIEKPKIEQKPVAYKWQGELFTPGEIRMLEADDAVPDDAVPLYAHPVIEGPVAWMYDFPNPNNPGEDIVRDWVAQSMEEVERNHGFNVRPLYIAGGSP